MSRAGQSDEERSPKRVYAVRGRARVIAWVIFWLLLLVILPGGCMFAPEAVVVAPARRWIQEETLGTGTTLQELRKAHWEGLKVFRREKPNGLGDILVEVIKAKLGPDYVFLSFEEREMVFSGRGVELRLRPAGFHIRYMAVRASEDNGQVWRTDNGVSFGATKWDVVRAYGLPSYWFADRLIYMQATGSSAWDALTVTFGEDGTLEFRVNDNSIDGLSPPAARFMLIWTVVVVVALIVYGRLLSLRQRA